MPFLSAITRLLSRCFLWMDVMPTSYEIYQTYLRGPAAVIRLFEQALGTQAIYGPPDPDTQQRAIEGLSEDIGRLKHQIARLQEELRETRSDNHRLRRRNAELEAVITKDSHNSSRPPSTDPPMDEAHEEPAAAIRPAPGWATWSSRPHVTAVAQADARGHAPPGAMPPLPRVTWGSAEYRRRAAAGRRPRAREVAGHGTPGRGRALPSLRAAHEG